MHMPFGRHRGTRLEDLPDAYVSRLLITAIVVLGVLMLLTYVGFLLFFRSQF
jgi:uncharacterized protein (DUF3820 family)